MSRLAHSTVYQNDAHISTKLPFIDDLLHYHQNGEFPLVKDPLVTKKATIIGMFVLRPGENEPFSGSLLDNQNYPSSIYNQNIDWIYNVSGLDGGWIIANGNSVDAYRLALQYSASDAVIFSSNNASIEGVASEHSNGYLWQAYALGEWKQLKSVDPNIADKIAEQRIAWQKLGYLSSRKYSAAIIFTKSGQCYPGQHDFLEARIFNEYHPDGSEIEIYIMTSEIGAANIRQRATKFNLQNRIESMLIIIPPKITSPTNTLSSDMDIALIPQILHDKYDMKIVNHDGGQKVLSEFSKVGALAQMNLTLARQTTVKEIITTHSAIIEDKRKNILSTFQSRISYFFPTTKYIPSSLRPVYVIQDSLDEVAVVTFDVSEGFDFEEK